MCIVKIIHAFVASAPYRQSNIRLKPQVIAPKGLGNCDFLEVNQSYGLKFEGCFALKTFKLLNNKLEITIEKASELQ